MEQEIQRTKESPELLYKKLDKQATRTKRAKPGNLTYLGDKKKKVDWSKSKKVGEAKPKKERRALMLILPIFVSVLLAAFMLIQFAPSKNDFFYLDDRITQLVIPTDSTTSLQSAVSELQIDVKTQSGRLDSNLELIQQQLDALDKRIAVLEGGTK